jgi:hypothetical protein
MRDMWESFIWVLYNISTWVQDLIMTWWEDSPLSFSGVVITIFVAFVVIFRPAE